MKGFFDLPSTVISSKRISKAFDCERCGLYKSVNSPKMKYTGLGKLGVLIIGEAPGKMEDQTGIQFKGQAGDLFRESLKRFGLQLDRDFFKINAINCRPTDSKGNNREPSKIELRCCERIWKKAIEEIKPNIIWLMGGKAVESFLVDYSHNVSNDISITRWRGLHFPDPISKAWVFPMFHPSYYLRNRDVETTFMKDLENGINLLNLDPPYFPDWKLKIKIIKDFDTVIEFLKFIIDSKPAIVFDYETNRLKPQYEGSLIHTVSISVWEEESCSFPLQLPGFWDRERLDEIISLWRKILSDPKIKKTAQNLQMEDSWSRVTLNSEVEGWEWDTMIASHIIDERDKYTSLDFQTFLNWGYEYGSEIEPFKRSGLDGFNQLHKAPLDSLLEYNGLDSLFTNKLKTKQKKIILENSNLWQAYQLFHEGTICLSDIEIEGIPIDREYYKSVSKNLEKRLEFLDKKLKSSPEANVYRDKVGHELKLNSPDQISELLFEVLGLPSTKKTDGGGKAVDFEVLTSLDTPFTNDLLKSRKLYKLKKTYIDGILNLETNGKIYPSFNLHLARTYRSTSSDPNFQNLPLRDEEANYLVRGGIIPDIGNRIVEIDYKQMELCILACYTKDERLIRYIEDKIDIHQEEADELGVSRFDAKNSFVFAEVYGSFWENVYKDLVKKGYNISKNKVRKAEEDFWKKFPGVLKWVQGVEESYRKNGYVEMFHGFRRRGFLSRNQIRNTPIQGTAFHCLQWSLNKLNEIRKKEEWKSKICGQIHDDIFFNANPKELDHMIKTSEKVMTKDIHIYQWMIVPLSVDVEMAEINQSWYYKKGLKDVPKENFGKEIPSSFDKKENNMFEVR